MITTFTGPAQQRRSSPTTTLGLPRTGLRNGITVLIDTSHTNGHCLCIDLVYWAVALLEAVDVAFCHQWTELN